MKKLPALGEWVDFFFGDEMLTFTTMFGLVLTYLTRSLIVGVAMFVSIFLVRSACAYYVQEYGIGNKPPEVEVDPDDDTTCYEKQTSD